MTYTLLRTAVWMSTWFLLERRFNSLKITHKWNSSGWYIYKFHTYISCQLLELCCFYCEALSFKGRKLQKAWHALDDCSVGSCMSLLRQSFRKLLQTNIPSHLRTKKFLQFSLLRQEEKNLMCFSRQALIRPSTRATLKSFGDVFAKSCNQCRCK